MPGPGEHELPVPGDGLVLERVQVQVALVVDSDDLPERTNHCGQQRHAPSALRGEDVVDAVRCDGENLLCEVFGEVVHHCVGTQRPDPVAGLLT